MNMSALEILESALATLKQTSKEDVKLKTKELGIEIPSEPKLSSLIDHFIFDFNGIFNEIINSNKTEWVDLETIKRKNVNIENILGCTIEEFRSYIESKFTEGMTFENHGEWHLDHIIPLASAKTEEEILKLNHYTNFQPLWAKDNLSKGSKNI